MEKNTKFLILEYIKSLQEYDEMIKEKKITMLSNTLKKLNKENIVKDVEKKGLPKYIIASSDIYEITKVMLNDYSVIIEGKIIDQKQLLVFVWKTSKSDFITYDTNKEIV